MKKFKLGDMEQRFAELIWDNEPINSRELTVICEAEFGWKRTTTYTMLKRLIEKDLFENDNGIVKSLMSKDEFITSQGQVLINESFNGSLPNFIAAFTRFNQLSKKEINEIQQLIDEYKEGN